MTRIKRVVHPAVRRIAWTRQGAQTVARLLQTPRVVSPARRLLMILIGNALIGLGVALFLNANLGLPPYDVLLSAISGRVPVTHGQAGMLLAAVFYLVAVLVKERPTGWSIIWSLGNGVAIDAINPLVGTPADMIGRILFAVVGTLSIAAAIAVVAHTCSTGGAFELWTRAAEKRGFRPARFRTGLELIILGLGIWLGGALGVATGAFALAIGLSITFVSQGLADHRAGRQARLAKQDRDWQLELRQLESLS